MIAIALLLSVGTVSFAQTVPVLSCNPGQSVSVGQTATIVATGGTGSFTFAAPGGNVSSVSGGVLNVSYSTAGNYTITVASGTQSATCNIVVTGTGTNTGTLACSPSVQTANAGQSVTFSASGGNGFYTWSGQNLVVINPTGTSFNVSYPSGGTRMITVTSGSESASCTINVVGNVVNIPGLPNTGGGASAQ